MEVALIGSERRVIQAPVVKVIAGAVGVPVLGREIDSNLHPMPLRLKISILGRVPRSWIRMKGHSSSDQEPEDGYHQECRSYSSMSQPLPINAVDNVIASEHHICCPTGLLFLIHSFLIPWSISRDFNFCANSQNEWTFCIVSTGCGLGYAAIAQSRSVSDGDLWSFDRSNIEFKLELLQGGKGKNLSFA